MADRKVIMVAGRPSGGTSLVAGALHHLGIDMGDTEAMERIAKGNIGNRRLYHGYEDANVYDVLGDLEGDPMYWEMDQAMREYLDNRLEKANGRAVGVKVPAMVMISRCPTLPTWPMVIVHADRNINTTFNSDIRYRGWDFERAAIRGVLDQALRHLLKRFPPVCRISYEEALIWPERAVDTLIDSLGLVPTPGEREAAIEFIDPVACKMGRKELAA
jgi:hypothetical protein